MKLFRGSLEGCLKGREVVLEVDLTVKLNRQPLRPIEFHWRDAVEWEISLQIKDGILVKVDDLSGPTPWVLNLVIFPKDTDSGIKPKIRLTCDSRLVNKAIKPTRYPS